MYLMTSVGCQETYPPVFEVRSHPCYILTLKPFSFFVLHRGVDFLLDSSLRKVYGQSAGERHD